MHSITLGKGLPTVLLLHGWKQSHVALSPLGDILGDTMSVHLLDLPGFGQSPNPPKPWGTEDYAEEVVRYIRENKLSNVILLGHSLGGRISVRIAAKYPELVSGLILIAAHGIPPQRDFSQQLKIKLLGFFRNILKKSDSFFGTTLFKDFFVPRFGSRDYLASGELRETLVKVVNENLSDQASKIAAPTVLIYGSKDTEAPPSIGKQYANLIKDSRYIELPGRDHFPFNGGGAHLCAHHIVGFLKDNGFLNQVSRGAANV